MDFFSGFWVENGGFSGDRENRILVVGVVFK